MRRKLLVLGSINRVVFTDIYIIGIRVQILVRDFGNVGEVVFSAGRCDVCFSELFVFLDGFLGPLTCIDHICAIFQKVHRNHVELKAASALQKQDFVVFRDIHKPAQSVLCAVQNIFEVRGPVGHLHHTHAASVGIKHFFRGPFQHPFRQAGRSG